jgi:hypothetical protein
LQKNDLYKLNNTCKHFCTIAQEIQEDIKENNINHQEYKIKIILPNFLKPIININKNATFKELATMIKKNFNFESIEFRTWDHSTISLGNDLNSCIESGNLIFLKIDNFEWQLLNYDFIVQSYNDIFEMSNLIDIY